MAMLFKIISFGEFRKEHVANEVKIEQYSNGGHKFVKTW
jgi:hypothetical protein